MFLVSLCKSDTIHFQGMTQFDEISYSDSISGAFWHKKWNNYLPYKCTGSQHSIVEEVIDDNWSCKDQKGQGFGEGFKMNIFATRWDYANGQKAKKIWQLKTTGSS